MNSIEVQVKDLTVIKNRTILLDEINFSIQPSEFVAILGPNGAGKTTLLKALTGERPYDGHIYLRETPTQQEFQEFYEAPSEWLQKIGYVPIDNVLHEQLTILEALKYIGRLRLPHLSIDQLEAKIERLLDEFDIASDKRTRQIRTLSSGERKRANICAELLTEPGLLLLDEPTSNLDPHFEDELMYLLSQQASRGTTIIVISHTINGLRYCNRAIFLANSEVEEEIYNEYVAEIRNQPKIDKLFADKPYKHWIETFGKGSTKEREKISLFQKKPQRKLPPSATRHHNQVIKFSFWQHYRIILQREMRLAWLFGYLAPLAFGVIGGVLLLFVLPPNALIELEDESISIKAGFVTQATFFIALVTFLIGILGSYRTIVSEHAIYLYERTRGLRAPSYLLAKFTFLGLMYGIIAPFIMYMIVNTTQPPPIGLIGNGIVEVTIVTLLTGLASVALGLVVSALTPNVDKANALMGFLIIGGALLARPPDNKNFETIVNNLSIFTPSRWGMEGLKTTTEFYCWENVITWQIRDHYSLAHTLAVWLALVVFVMVSLALAYLALYNKDTWFHYTARFQRLFTSNVFIGSLTLLTFVLMVNYPFYELTRQSHACTVDKGELCVPQPDVVGFQSVVESVRGLRCEVEAAIVPPTRSVSTSIAPTSQPTSTPPLPVSSTTTPSPTPSTTPVLKNTSTPTPINTATITVLPATITPTPTNPPTLTPTSTNSPTPTNVPTLISTPDSPGSLRVIVDEPTALHFAPTARDDFFITLVPKDAELFLLTKSDRSGSWIRAYYIDEGGLIYFGWVEAASSIFEGKIFLSIENKVPPTCAIPLGNIYQDMNNVDLINGRLGTWDSNGSGNMVIVVDLYRTNDEATTSDALQLHINLNNVNQQSINIASLKQKTLLVNGVYNVKVDGGDQLELIVTPSSSNTVQTLAAHVSLFLIPDECEFSDEQ